MVAAGLCVWLVGSVLLGETVGTAATIVKVLLGGLIYVDIMRRENSKPLSLSVTRLLPTVRNGSMSVVRSPVDGSAPLRLEDQSRN